MQAEVSAPTRERRVLMQVDAETVLRVPHPIAMHFFNSHATGGADKG
jgi:hypothetical protein